MRRALSLCACCALLQQARHWPSRRHSRDRPHTDRAHAHGHAQPHAIKSAPHARGAHSIASTDPSAKADDSDAGEADGKVAGAGHRCWTGFNSSANNAAAANLMRGCEGIVEKTASLSWKRGSEDERKRRKKRKSPHGTMEPGSRCAPEIFLSFVSSVVVAEDSSSGDRRKCFIGLNNHCAKTRARVRGEREERGRGACLNETFRA